MTDLLQNSNNDYLQYFNGIAFAGGFSYSDVLGSANGWYTNITQNNELSKQFNDFYNHPEKFSIGICNGCQLMSRLGWIKGLKGEKIKLEKNISDRFESSFPTIKVKNTKSIFEKYEKNLFWYGALTEKGRFTMSEKSFKYLNEKDVYHRYVDSKNKIN